VLGHEFYVRINRNQMGLMANKICIYWTRKRLFNFEENERIVGTFWLKIVVKALFAVKMGVLSLCF